jgi:protein-S-isoprenylcysteine O-methyltransferase Ste14
MLHLAHIQPQQVPALSALCLILGAIGFPPMMGLFKPHSVAGWTLVCAAMLGSSLLAVLLVGTIALGNY